jgi:hypothetical protein
MSRLGAKEGGSPFVKALENKKISRIALRLNSYYKNLYKEPLYDAKNSLCLKHPKLLQIHLSRYTLVQGAVSAG